MSDLAIKQPEPENKAAPITAVTPIPFELLNDSMIPSHLSGINGVNRARGSAVKQISANTDRAAIECWLDEFETSPSTFRSYKKEVERFYNWVLFNRGVALSSLTREDFDDYARFLENPQPREFWCAQPAKGETKIRRNHLKSSGDWRPFMGPVTGDSKALAMRIIGALLSYLVATRYLDGNPQAARRRKNRQTKGKDAGTRMLPLDILKMAIDHIRSEADKCADDPKTNKQSFRKRCRLERQLFVIRFLANTGLRREELASSAMSDIYSDRDVATSVDCWYIRVIGKGAKIRHVALNASARESLSRYRRFFKASVHNIGNHEPILISLITRPKKSKLGTSANTIYDVVKDAMSFAQAAFAADEDAEAAMKASLASPHWFRHSFATISGQLGIELKIIQEQLGHESIETTANYQHAEKAQMYHAFSKLSF